MNPLVTIIMATYNRAHFIVETLQSIQKQRYINWECLIIDDGGIDDTLEVLQPILDNDIRFHYLKRPNTYKKGLPGCRNYGLDVAKGNYIIFFDDDDIVHPDNLKIGIELLTQNSEFLFCHYNKKPFEGQFNYNELQSIGTFNKMDTDFTFIEKMVTNVIPVASCTVLFKAQCFSTIRFVESLQYAEEWECFQRVFCNHYKGVLIDAVLYFNRKHPNSNTGEFYNNDPIRIASKKEAIQLVAENLASKNKLNTSILNYLVGFALAFRDVQLLKTLMTIAKVSVEKRLYLTLKFKMYPLWKQYKKMVKKIK